MCKTEVMTSAQRFFGAFSWLWTHVWRTLELNLFCQYWLRGFFSGPGCCLRDYGGGEGVLLGGWRNSSGAGDNAMMLMVSIWYIWISFVFHAAMQTTIMRCTRDVFDLFIYSTVVGLPDGCYAKPMPQTSAALRLRCVPALKRRSVAFGGDLISVSR